MLDKTSAEYKTVLKLYKQGKISETDLNRLLEALEGYEQPSESETAVSGEEQAERTVGQLLKELGIKIRNTVKAGWNAVNNATEKAVDSLRAVLGLEDGSASEPEEAPDPCRSPEQYLIPYEKMHVKLHYIGKKTVEMTAKANKTEKLSRKCEKLMSVQLSEKLNSLLAEQFVGKYEYSADDEYMRLTVRPKKQL